MEYFAPNDASGAVRLSVGVPQTSRVEILTPKVMVLGGEVFGGD